MSYRKERVIYGICKSTEQDEAFYDSEVKTGQVPSRGQRRDDGVWRASRQA